jgi:hypothetical protein
LISIFREYPDVGLSIGGVTIKSRSFLNIAFGNPVSGALAFTDAFFDERTFTAPEFSQHFLRVLRELHHDGLTVAGVTSDGCPFQQQSLSWRDNALIQRKDPSFSRLIFIPCVCHRLQYSLVLLFKTNLWDQKLISGVRHASVVLLKPRNRIILGSISPSHCITRWIYDYPIVRFILDHDEIVNDILAANRDKIELPNEVSDIFFLLEKIFLAVHELESDDASVVRARPAVND